MSDQIPAQIPAAPVSPALVVVAVLGTLQTIIVGLAGLDVVPVKVLAVTGLVVGAVLVTFTRVVYGTVTPWSTVAAKRAPDGAIVAGPAASTINLNIAGPAVGEPVDVTPQ